MLVLTHLAGTCFFNKYQFCGITVRPPSEDLLEFYYPHKDLKTASQVLLLGWSPILFEVYRILIYYFFDNSNSRIYSCNKRSEIFITKNVKVLSLTPCSSVFFTIGKIWSILKSRISKDTQFNEWKLLGSKIEKEAHN
jgi:transposase